MFIELHPRFGRLLLLGRDEDKRAKLRDFADRFIKRHRQKQGIKVHLNQCQPISVYTQIEYHVHELPSIIYSQTGSMSQRFLWTICRYVRQTSFAPAPAQGTDRTFLCAGQVLGRIISASIICFCHHEVATYANVTRSRGLQHNNL